MTPEQAKAIKARLRVPARRQMIHERLAQLLALRQAEQKLERGNPGLVRLLDRMP
jgi:hypothetical protein